MYKTAPYAYISHTSSLSFSHLSLTEIDRMRIDIDGLEVAFPYPSMYKEQLQYVRELKKALDEGGHGLLEMPTGTLTTSSSRARFFKNHLFSLCRNGKDSSAVIVDSSIQSKVSCENGKVDLLHQNGTRDGTGHRRAQDHHRV